jgi:hypothetical protein
LALINRGWPERAAQGESTHGHATLPAARPWPYCAHHAREEEHCGQSSGPTRFGREVARTSGGDAHGHVVPPLASLRPNRAPIALHRTSASQTTGGAIFIGLDAVCAILLQLTPAAPSSLVSMLYVPSCCSYRNHHAVRGPHRATPKKNSRWKTTRPPPVGCHN